MYLKTCVSSIIFEMVKNLKPFTFTDLSLIFFFTNLNLPFKGKSPCSALLFHVAQTGNNRYEDIDLS